MLKEPEHNTTNNPLTWFGQVCRNDGWLRFTGKQEHRRPRKTWQQYVNYNLKSLRLSKTQPQTVMLGNKH